MNLCWLTDIHLNFLNDQEMISFLSEIDEANPEAILISGDIGDSNSIVSNLQLFRDRFTIPVYFVLGNHDYYHSSIAKVEQTVIEICKASKNLFWIDQADPILLGDGMSLVGHGSWADGRFGDFNQSEVMLNDYLLIKELSNLRKVERLLIMQQLADKAATHFDSILPRALSETDHVICLTHVPPFREACWHEGSISDDMWLPHFSCKIVGEVLTKHMGQFPEKRMTVLCGHTHSSGVAMLSENLKVITGHATYSSPEIQRIPEW